MVFEPAEHFRLSDELIKAPVRVLILDDDPDITGIQQVILEDMGCEVTVANDFPAFRRALAQSCDLLVLDLMMPWTDGITVLRFLADNRFLAPILLSSSTEEKVMRSVRSLGDLRGLHVLGHLRKPFRPDEFVNEVEQVLSSHRLLVERTFDPEDVVELVESDAFRMYYQPMFNLRFGRVEALEALVRAKHPEKGLLKPDAFLRTVETTALLRRFTERSIELVFEDMAAWERRGLTPRVAINIAGRSLDDVTLPDLIVATAERHDVDLKRVQIEITETTLARHFANALEVLSRLRLKGVHLAIDDFGVAYSTQERLRGLPFSELKMDYSLTAAITEEEGLKVIQRCLDLCRELDLSCVAEGVETEQQLAILNRLECHQAQGFLLCKPMPASFVPGWLKTQQDRSTDSE